jgi:magnesium and cobalt exporter, CNNM family
VKLDIGSSSILPIFLLIVLHAVVTLAYAALTNQREAPAHDQLESGGTASSRLHITYQFSLLLIRFAIAALAITGVETALQATAELSHPVQVLIGVIVLLVIALVTLVLGEMVPEAIGSTRADSLANWALRPMRVLILVLSPLVSGILALSRWMAGMFGSSDKVNVFTEEEIMTMLDASEKEGAIENTEKEMIYSVLQFGDRLAREVMVPRIDVVGVELNKTIDEALKIFIDSGHSRLPVYEENIDTIRGLLYAKDLLNVMQDKTTKSISEIMRPTLFVPESKSADALLKELRFRKIHLAIVVDEYGGTAGIVTFEDLIEEIIGDVQDEYDVNEEAEFVQQGPNVWVVDASISLNDFNDLLDVEFSTEESDTLGGFVFTQLGHVPEAGEIVEHSNLVLRIDSIDGRRIRKIHVTRKVTSSASGERPSSSQAAPQAQPVTD